MPNLLMSRLMKAKYFNKEELLKVEPKQQSSWIWKSWMHAKYLMERGLRYQVGDGKSIKVWEHKCPPKLPMKPLSLRPEHSYLTTVNELMKERGRVWNGIPIRQLFSQQEAECIRQIPISQLRAKDRLVWHFTKKGNYTMNSGYQLTVNIMKEKRAEMESSMDPKVARRKWKTL